MNEVKEKMTVWEYTDRLAEMIEQKIEVLEKYQEKLTEIGTYAKQGRYDPEDILERLEWVMLDICDEFRNCQTCPIEDACEFARKGCKEMYNCEGCPRLPLCLDREILEVSPKKKDG
jgi:hypothetical protein